MLFSRVVKLHFYISTFRCMCAVHNLAVFCSSLLSCIPGVLFRYYCYYYYYYFIIIIIIIIVIFIDIILDLIQDFLNVSRFITIFVTVAVERYSTTHF